MVPTGFPAIYLFSVFNYVFHFGQALIDSRPEKRMSTPLPAPSPIFNLDGIPCFFIPSHDPDISRFAVVFGNNPYGFFQGADFPFGPIGTLCGPIDGPNSAILTGMIGEYFGARLDPIHPGLDNFRKDFGYVPFKLRHYPETPYFFLNS
jgi:hypothetical protein